MVDSKLYSKLFLADWLEMFSAIKKWAKGGNEDSKLSTPMGVRAMGQALQRKFARGIQYNMKIVIKGDRNTGKTCLFQRLQGKPFNEQYIPTNEIQVASIHWNYRTTDDVVKVEVWDVVDKGKSKKSQNSLKLENDSKAEGEKDATVLDAEFVDVYKGAHGVLMTMDITKPWTFKYIERELPKVPPHIPVLVLANHRDMGEHRLVPKDEVVAFIQHLERPDRSPPVHYAETSMKNGFGLKYIHKFLNLPFLLLQRETLLKQLQVNSEDMESTLEELQIHKETEEQDYVKFVNLLEKRRRDQEAKKAASAAATVGEGGGRQNTSSTTPSGVDRAAKSRNGSSLNDGSSRKERPARKTPSATGQETSQEVLPQNGLSHSTTNIDEFVPEDELDAGFLDEEASSRGKKRANKPAAKKLTAPNKVELSVSEDSDSDSDRRNPMVAGFAEDIDSEDEPTTPVIANHVNEELNNKEQFRTPNKPFTAVNVELTSSEEEEDEEYKRNEEEEEEEEERKEREKKRKEEERGKEKQKERSETVRLKLEMPVKSLMTEEPVVDGLGLGTEDVNDWLNSPDSDPKIPFRASAAHKEHKARKSDTPSSSPAVPIDEWEKFMASQMQQTKGTPTSSNSLIDMGLDGDDKGDTNEESKSRKKKEHKSGEKSKQKPRKHRDKGEEGEDSERKDKERRKSRHKEGEEGKDRRRSRDEEGEKKKKHRSKHSRAKTEEGVQDGVTYEEL